MSESTVIPPTRRFRWRVVIITLIIALPIGSAVWWNSPGGRQWRKMREAERWLNWATPALREDPRFAKVEFHVSTREEIVLLGYVERLSDVTALGRLMEQLEPPCPVRVLEVRDANGEEAVSEYLVKPDRSP